MDVHKLITVTDALVVVSAYQCEASEDESERVQQRPGIEAVPFYLILRATVRRAPKGKDRLGFTPSRPSTFPEPGK